MFGAAEEAEEEGPVDGVVALTRQSRISGTVVYSTPTQTLQDSGPCWSLLHVEESGIVLGTSAGRWRNRVKRTGRVRCLAVGGGEEGDYCRTVPRAMPRVIPNIRDRHGNGRTWAISFGAACRKRRRRSRRLGLGLSIERECSAPSRSGSLN